MCSDTIRRGFPGTFSVSSVFKSTVTMSCRIRIASTKVQSVPKTFREISNQSRDICNSSTATNWESGDGKVYVCIFKKGNKQDISNYRPISLLTSFFKIIEKLIYARLHAHIDMNNILVQEQYGFRIHSSPEQAVFTLINSIVTAMNNNQMEGGIFCDLQKVFDCVNHKILL
jgi:hypothetical protein